MENILRRVFVDKANDLFKLVSQRSLIKLHLDVWECSCEVVTQSLRIPAVKDGADAASAPTNKRLPQHRFGRRRTGSGLPPSYMGSEIYA